MTNSEKKAVMCPSCGSEVSTTALRCMNCGAAEIKEPETPEEKLSWPSGLRLRFGEREVVIPGNMIKKDGVYFDAQERICTVEFLAEEIQVLR